MVKDQKISKLIKKAREKKVRTLEEMRRVIFDKEWFEKANKKMILYSMYRGIEFKKNLRYDITVLPPLLLGEEFLKTKGHRHLKCKEKYIVLKGEALFLLQKYNEKKNLLEKVIVFKAKKGDTISIPPKYDHITINPSRKITLVLGNWISKNAKSDYSILEKKKGTAYFYTLKGWKKNKEYKDIPKIEFKSFNCRGGEIGKRARFRT